MSSLTRRVRVAVPVLGAVALAGAAVPVSALPAFAGDAPDGVDADAGRDAASGAAARHASDPRVQLRELFGLDASPGRIAELMVEGHHDPMSPWLVTPEERAHVERQLATQQQLMLVQKDLRADLGAAYAGVSIDQTDHGRITVKVAGDVAASTVVALVRGLVPTAGAVDVERAEYGLDELEALTLDVTGDLAGHGDFVGAGVNEESNQVDVVINDDDMDTGVEAATADDPRLEPVQTTPIEPVASWPSHGAWPGDGLGWEQSGNVYDCSMGFGVHSHSNIQSGNYPPHLGPLPNNYALIAGHCAANGQRWRTEFGAGIPWLEVGTVVRSTYSRTVAHADVAVVELAPNVHVRDWTKYLGGRVWPLLPPTDSSPVLGSAICKSGRATGVSCGLYNGPQAFATLNHPPSRPGPWPSYPSSMVVTRLDSFGAPLPFNNNFAGQGDSGGLVFQPSFGSSAKVLGIHVGMSTGNPYHTNAYYSSWSSIQAEIGTQFAFGNR